ncbi:MAG: FkbM family methyltransferase [Magnetococcales bacterium]|nr:FkbM family methyltransferase [Magnetococcales bacterium]
MPLLLKSPLEFPVGLPFFLWGRDEYAHHAESFLRALGRVDGFKGFIVHPAPWRADPQSFLVLASPSWPRDLALLRRLDVPDEALALFLMPWGNPHGYCELFKDHLNEITLVGEGNEVSFSLDDHRAILSRLGIHSLHAGREPMVNQGAYYVIWADWFERYGEQTRQSAEAMGDAASRELLLSLIHWNPEDYFVYYAQRIFHSVQYFDFNPIRPGEVILNLGVESGFELPYFLHLVGDEGQIHNVDPLGDDFLHPAVRPVVEAYPERLTWHRVAAMDYDGEIELALVDAGRQASLRNFDATESRSFPCLTLETLVNAAGITRLDRIKLDVEGAEERLLPGLLHLAQRFRPLLAISVYHAADHLVVIPHYLMHHLRDYDFHLGHYSFCRYETVLYAIPREQRLAVES